VQEDLSTQPFSPGELSAIAKVNQDQEAKLRRLRGLRDISEGLGNVRFVTGAHLRSGLYPSSEPRYKAEGIREQIAKEEDRLSPDEVAMMSRMLGVPSQNLQNLSSSRLREILPVLSTHLNRKMALESMDFQRKQNYDLRKQNSERIRAQDAKDIAGYDTALDLIDQIELEQPKYSTGILDELGSKTREILPTVTGALGDATGRAAFRQKVIVQLNDYINVLSGKATTAAEAARLRSAVPSMWDQEDIFVSKLRSLRGEIENARKNRLEALQSSKRDVSGFDMGGDSVMMIDSKGNEYPVRADAVDAAIEAAKAQGETLRRK